jgi:uncharacterized membrane protein YhaH (DUF805 family)
MGFGEAIQSGFGHYVDFSGRASRSAYWWWTLFAVLAGGAAYLLDLTVVHGNGNGVQYGLVSVLLFLPGLTVAFRRLHDTNRSGWWVWICLVPIVGWLVFLVFTVMPGTPGPNKYGGSAQPPRLAGTMN